MHVPPSARGEPFDSNRRRSMDGSDPSGKTVYRERWRDGTPLNRFSKLDCFTTEWVQKQLDTVTYRKAFPQISTLWAQGSGIIELQHRSRGMPPLRLLRYLRSNPLFHSIDNHGTGAGTSTTGPFYRSHARAHQACRIAARQCRSFIVFFLDLTLVCHFVEFVVIKKRCLTIYRSAPGEHLLLESGWEIT